MPRSPLFLFLITTRFLVASLACEGECITGITSVFNGNYTIPLRLVFLSLADEISNQLLPPSHTSTSYLDPLLLAYKSEAPATLQKAIFPSYFHGKCQDPETGVNLPGCPNPDCPVVCGTPGSLVHFYPRLRYIAYNTTWHLLHELAKPGGTVFSQIQANVEAIREDEGGARRRRSTTLSEQRGNYRRFSSFWATLADSPVHPAGVISLAIAKRSDSNFVRETLSRIFQDIRPLLEKICGGTGDGTTNSLPYCSWEQSMKEYILTFP